MAVAAELTTDPEEVLARGGEFLASDPVRHNLIATLLRARASVPGEGRYVLAVEAGEVCGVVFQSPLTYVATITPMPAAVSEACVDLLVREGAELPGVNGEAGSTARFAGQWSERTKSGARPDQGLRIYEAQSIQMPPGVPGGLRRAALSDRTRIGELLRGFQEDTGEARPDDPVTDRRIAAGQFWLWEDPPALSMAALTPPILGVCRVQAVYTPPEWRNRGYAGAGVARLSAQTLESGHRCILYTDLGNPISNSVYRRIGYRPVAECLRYSFGPRA